MTSRGGSGRLPKAAGSMPVDWEDKYRRLHAQHGELKGIYATMQDHNKKMQTKKTVQTKGNKNNEKEYEP